MEGGDRGSARTVSRSVVCPAEPVTTAARPSAARHMPVAVEVGSWVCGTVQNEVKKYGPVWTPNT